MNDVEVSHTLNFQPDKDINQKAKHLNEFLSSDELFKSDFSKTLPKREDGVLPGSSCYKQRAEMEMKKEQAAKLSQNAKQAYLGKSYKVYNSKKLNPMKEQYMDKRIKNPVNTNFHHPPADGKDKINILRNHRKKLLNQQKERFKNKYRETGMALLEKNKSLDNLDQYAQDSSAQKNDSFHLESLVNPNKASFNKTKVPDDSAIEYWGDKRKGLSTVHQLKRNKIKNKDKPDIRVIF